MLGGKNTHFELRTLAPIVANASALYPLKDLFGKTNPHLVQGHLDARIGNDPQQVGQIAAVKGPIAAFLINFQRAVEQRAVLACFPQTHASFEHLKG